MNALPPNEGRSWWLREALALPEFAGDPCPPLETDAKADVVILGGGYAGMWTAWFLGPEPRAAVLVACEVDGRVVGFANAGPSRDEGSAGNTGELRAIYVLKEVQGTGVGTRLLDAAEERLRTARFDRATLWVLETNDLGRRFYEKAGWRWDGTVSEHQFECANRPIVRYVREL